MLIIRDATIPFFQNLSDTAHSEDRQIPIQSYTSQFFFLYVTITSILLCVDPIVTLLCVKHNILKCFSSGRSKVLGMQPKRELRDRSERVADCLQPKKRHQQKTLNDFLMRDFYFKRRAGKRLPLLSDHLTQMQAKERKSA